TPRSNASSLLSISHPLLSPSSSPSSSFFFFFSCYVAHRDLHSFPTRRSSDLYSPSSSSTNSVIRCARRWRRPSTSIWVSPKPIRSEEHTSELQSRENLVCRLLLEKKKKKKIQKHKNKNN